jgi:serine/threonine protein kinase
VYGVEYIPEFLRSRGYLVMEKVQGSHMLNYVYDNGPFDELKAKRIVQQIIEGIDYMHEKGVVHRDLNPTNVFLVDEEKNQIKILDFNVSKLIDMQTLLPKDGDLQSPKKPFLL